MRPAEDASLTGGGDCLSHWHSVDRIPTADFLHGLHAVCKTVEVASDYSIKDEDDLLLVEGLATVTLPRARNKQEYTVVRTGTFNVVIETTGSDTISGASSLTLTTQWSSRTFKAITGGWVIINGYL